jgi:hypothetical protein
MYASSAVMRLCLAWLPCVLLWRRRLFSSPLLLPRFFPVVLSPSQHVETLDWTCYSRLVQVKGCLRYLVPPLLPRFFYICLAPPLIARAHGRSVSGVCDVWKRSRECMQRRARKGCWSSRSPGGKAFACWRWRIASCHPRCHDCARHDASCGKGGVWHSAPAP